MEDLIIELFDKGYEYSFLKVFPSSDGKILRCTAETYDRQKISGLDIIFKDDKKRRKKTLEKIGVTEEQLLNGIDEDAGMRMLSEYFIDHNGIIIGYMISSVIRKINDRISKYFYKTINCHQMDLARIAKQYGIKTTDDMQATLAQCLKQCRRIRRIKQNKFDCIVNYVYHMTLDHGKIKDIIYCDTTIGRIFYDIEKDVWAMSKKEMCRTGHQIENFDIEDIKQQIRQRYKIRNMSELMLKLKNAA